MSHRIHFTPSLCECACVYAKCLCVFKNEFVGDMFFFFIRGGLLWVLLFIGVFHLFLCTYVLFIHDDKPETTLIKDYIQ